MSYVACVLRGFKTIARRLYITFTLNKAGGGDKLAVAVGSKDELVVGLCPLAPGVHDAVIKKQKNKNEMVSICVPPTKKEKITRHISDEFRRGARGICDKAKLFGSQLTRHPRC